MTGRGLEGRRRAQSMLVVPMVLVGFVGFLFIASPHGMGGGGWSPFGFWVSWVGVVGFTIGVAWMIRIYRATLDPEAHRSAWRSRGR